MCEVQFLWRHNFFSPEVLSATVNVTGFEKKTSFHTHYIKLMILPKVDCWLNILLYSWVPCFEVMSLVSVAAFARPCLSLKWSFSTISWSWPSGIDAYWVSHEGLANVFHLQFGMLWVQARSTRGPLTFNRLCTPFYIPIIIQPILYLYPLPLLLPRAVSLISWKNCSKELEF